MDLNSRNRLSHRSVGQFDPKAWINEGDGLLASAAKTREIWTNHRRNFSQTIKQRESESPERASIWSLLTGLPRASMLLLAYSVEMYLKAGLAKVYFGCSEDIFERDVKGTFGHNLVALATEIDFEIKDEDKQNFILLTQMIRVDARYPVFVRRGESHAETVNKQTARIWSSPNFGAFIELANRVKEHSRNIDANSDNPMSYISCNIDDDGYLAFRVGGNLSPRITYRFSSVQKRTGETSMDDMKGLFASPQFHQLTFYWGVAKKYKDDAKRIPPRA